MGNESAPGAVAPRTGVAVAEILGPTAYWIPKGGGVVEDYLERDYNGDNANSRVIVLGAAYDYAEVMQVGNFPGTGAKSFLGRAWNTGNKDFFWSTGTAVSHVGGSDGACVTRWQGFQTGGTELLLGTVGASSPGANQTGVTYKIRAWKYSAITP